MPYLERGEAELLGWETEKETTVNSKSTLCGRGSSAAQGSLNCGGTSRDPFKAICFVSALF